MNMNLEVQKPDAGKAAGTTVNGPYGELVLLFYDGFEIKARPGRWGKLYSNTRSVARTAYRYAKGVQINTGFYTAFQLLERALHRAGCDVRVNDFNLAMQNPRYPIGLAGYPSVLENVRLPNPIIFGPGDYGYPDEVVSRIKGLDIRKLIQPSDWAAGLYYPDQWGCRTRMMVWPVGIDTEAYPDISGYPKTIDFLIYDKIRWNRDVVVPALLDDVVARLEAANLSFQILRYGEHKHSDFMSGLRQSRALLFLCEHETQGLAYQEALASNIPVLAWDEGVLVDPRQREFLTDDLVISAVPYFDSRCGEKFKRDEFPRVLKEFLSKRGSYQPRQYISETLSLARSADTYLKAYRELKTD
ncbi:MAG: glycosyltransferase [Hyphomicrobium sp.]|uniref:glycosyltransferase n=1 Tax=Hyphomicrobium sp. TaxID=82 RepID=UPI0039E29CFA